MYIKKGILSFIIFFAAGFCTLSAGTIDDFIYTPDNTDMAMYLSYSDVFKYLKSGGINPDEYMMVIGEYEAERLDEIIQKFNLKFTDLNDILFSASLNGLTGNNPGFLLQINVNGKGSIPQEMLTSPLKTEYGTIYMIDNGSPSEVYFAKLDTCYIIGTKDSVITFMKKKSMKVKDAPSFHKNFIRVCKGKTFYVNFYAADIMKFALDAASAAGAGSQIEVIRANLFLKSLMAVKSFDASIEMKDGFIYNIGMYGVSGEDADRLVMVSHCFIVNTSFLMTFAELMIDRLNNPEIQAYLGDAKSIRYVQDVLARAKVVKTTDGVIVTMDITKKESDEYLASFRKIIEQQKKARVERHEREKISNLTNAIINNDMAGAEKILAAISDVNVRDTNGDYPLAIAAMYGNMKIIKALVAKGAKVDLPSTNGNTALHFAVSAGMYDATVYLVEKGAGVNVRNDEGMTALYINSSQGDSKITIYLLKKGSDVNAVSGDGYAPIHRAAESGNLDVIKALVQYKADVELVNSYQERAIDIAARNGFDDIVNYFRVTFKQEPVQRDYEESEYNDNDSGDSDSGESDYSE